MRRARRAREARRARRKGARTRQARSRTRCRAGGARVRLANPHVRARVPAVARAAVAPAAGEGGQHVREARRAARRAASVRTRPNTRTRAGGIRGVRDPPDASPFSKAMSDEAKRASSSSSSASARSLTRCIASIASARNRAASQSPPGTPTRRAKCARARRRATPARSTNLTGIPRASRRGFAHRRGVRRERVDRLLLGQRAPGTLRRASKRSESLDAALNKTSSFSVHLAAERQERGEAPEAHGRAGRQRVRPGARRCKLARGTPPGEHARACIGLGRDSDVHQDGRQEPPARRPADPRRARTSRARLTPSRPGSRSGDARLARGRQPRAARRTRGHTRRASSGSSRARRARSGGCPGAAWRRTGDGPGERGDSTIPEVLNNSRRAHRPRPARWSRGRADREKAHERLLA